MLAIATCRRTLFTATERTAGAQRVHAERRLLGYTPEQVFDVVSDVDQYSAFVPWCTRSRVLARTDTRMTAEVAAGFGAVSEAYTSEVTLRRPHFVKVRAADSTLFAHLASTWRFAPHPPPAPAPGAPSGCEVDFVIAFEFRSVVHASLASAFFDDTARAMVGAFERRCEAVWGAPAFPSRVLPPRL